MPVRALLVGLVLLLAACGGDDRAVAWGGLDLRLPDGWVVVEDRPGALSIANGAAGEESGDPGDRLVRVHFTNEPSTTMDDWRTLVADQEGTIERDEEITVDGLAASLLQFSFPGSPNDAPTREQVVIVPSRSLVALFQAVPVQGQQDAPEVFDAHADEFAAIRESVDFGAPEDYLD